MFGFFRYLWRRSEGSAAVEFALVCIPLLLITIGIMEFSFALFQWNSAKKATQMGVRMAVVSTPVAAGLNAFDGLTGSKVSGDEPPGSFVSTAGSPIVCDGALSTCTNVAAGINGSFSTSVHARIVDKMRAIFPLIAAENVVVEYFFTGLGFASRPCGPVPSVTVRLKGMTFDFIVINSLLSLVAGGGGLPASLTMPGFPATMTGEDLSTAGHSGSDEGPLCQ